MAEQRKVGFIGLGIMGKPMAKNIRKAGFPLTVYNRTESKAQELVDMGATLAHSPAEVAKASDIVITIVSDTPDVRRVMLGEGGVVEGAHPVSYTHLTKWHRGRATRVPFLRAGFGRRALLHPGKFVQKMTENWRIPLALRRHSWENKQVKFERSDA